MGQGAVRRARLGMHACVPRPTAMQCQARQRPHLATVDPQNTRPMNSPPATAAARPSSVTPPLVPRRTGRRVVIRRGSSGLHILAHAGRSAGGGGASESSAGWAGLPARGGAMCRPLCPQHAQERGPVAASAGRHAPELAQLRGPGVTAAAGIVAQERGIEGRQQARRAGIRCSALRRGAEGDVGTADVCGCQCKAGGDERVAKHLQGQHGAAAAAIGRSIQAQCTGSAHAVCSAAWLQAGRPPPPRACLLPVALPAPLVLLVQPLFQLLPQLQQHREGHSE